jgi:anti-sigma factor RsiW
MSMNCEDVERFAGAYADGELDLERTLALEAHVSTCAACTTRLDEARAVKNALRAAPYFRAPEALAARVRAAAAAASTDATGPARQANIVRVRRNRRRPWLLSAVGLAAAALVFVVVLRERTTVADDATTEAVIEGHVRSLMAGHLVDVASTDRHTVKPWFAGRVDFSPTVVDLVTDGFPLVGGRVDYIDRHTAAALIYKRRDHVINVFVWPQATGSPSHVTRSDVRGYHLISWTRGGMAVWIVSDLALSELEDFGRKLDAAMND